MSRACYGCPIEIDVFLVGFGVMQDIGYTAVGNG
jgi:hypothetical protein